ncbi:hypothetical protein NMY22_g9723 [Coprinellus aureogranulatus]|nr:hypothetical protein NMY22_g9723 [Coprinellus aureogranulatus]
MIDVDYVGADISGGVTRHWLANGVTIGDDNTVSNATATTITPYGGPWPAPGSGSHRYIVALYQQPADFAAPEGFTGPLEISKMDFLKYVEDSNLGPLVAANYINVEEGTSTLSAVATSAVVSSTLAPGSSATTGTGTTRSAGSSTSTGAGSEPTNSALKLALSPVAALVVAGLGFVTL